MHNIADRLIATRRYDDCGAPAVDLVYRRVVEINDVFAYLQYMPWQVARTVIGGGKAEAHR